MIRDLRLKIVLISLLFFGLPFFVSADFLGQKTNFFVDSEFDLNQREEIIAVLIKISPELYFYIDDDWWGAQNTEQQLEIRKALNFLAEEFGNKIYPILTNIFGYEQRPGIDGDERITILIHPMIEEAGGYFNSGDGYSRLRAPFSNQREMVYLNSEHINSPRAKSFLAHEFQHLITFNQKEKIRGVSEEIWLNEAYSEIAPTLVGYDKVYSGSNLEGRARIFVRNPNDSLTEWLNQRSDYGLANLFTQYLLDHYGIEILSGALQSSKTGIASINYALKKNGFEQNFSQIFTDWKIALLVNNCRLGPKYCYLNPHLGKLKVTPLTNFLPFVGQGTLAVTHTAKNWSANWHKFIGGQGALKLEFNGYDNVNFEAPYIIEDLDGRMTISFLDLDQNQDGEIFVPDFNTKNRSLTILPSIQDKFSGFNGQEKSFSFSWTASIVERTPEIEEMTVEELKAKIIEIQKKIIDLLKQSIQLLQTKIAELSAQKSV